MEREEHALEYLDRPLPASDLAASLADIERLAIFGGHRLSVRTIALEIDLTLAGADVRLVGDGDTETAQRIPAADWVGVEDWASLEEVALGIR